MAAKIGTSKFTQNSCFEGLIYNSCILMSIMEVKCRFSEPRGPNMISTMTFMNPIWPKFKMAAKIGTQRNLSFGSLDHNWSHKKVIHAPNLAQILLRDYFFLKNRQPPKIQNGRHFFPRWPPFQHIFHIDPQYMHINVDYGDKTQVFIAWEFKHDI